MITKLQIALINQLTNNCPIVVTHAVISIPLYSCTTYNCQNHVTLYIPTACQVKNVQRHINAGFSDRVTTNRNVKTLYLETVPDTPQRAETPNKSQDQAVQFVHRE